MTTQLFIPETVKVGFQERQGTYTGKLAYVIYYDHTGKLRKETSWQSWRDKKIDPLDIKNEPTEGFVLNKGVGGNRHSYGWNTRNEYIRVYDPRDFEFEISVANLLFILRECDCSKGKGLEGKFVYAWQGTELILLPVISTDYENSKSYTALQGQSVKSADLINGASYITKNQRVLTFVGRFDYYDIVNDGGYKANKVYKTKKYVFWNSQTFEYLDKLATIAKLQSDTITPDYAELVDKYAKSQYGSRVVKLFTKEVVRDKDFEWVVAKDDGSFDHFVANYYNHHDKSEVTHINKQCNSSLNKNGLLNRSLYERVYERHGYNYETFSGKYQEVKNTKLYAVLESGSEFRIRYGSFYEEPEKI